MKAEPFPLEDEQDISRAAHGGVVCALALLNARGDALLQLRDEKRGLSAAGLWVFPGGHAQPREDVVQCAAREFLEETEYRCDNARWLLSMDDAFLGPPTVRLHVFWDLYQEGRGYKCREGQALEFVERRRAAEIAMPEYLVAIWDLAWLAALADVTA
jgi:8-oxo-dGTP pyrophosphatase MutT (NUDIX family)